MRPLILLLFIFSSVISFGQLNLEKAKAAGKAFNFFSYHYNEQFEGMKGYGAPIIITKDGGAISFGYSIEDSTKNITKIDKKGNLDWRTPIKPLHKELEAQSVVEGKDGKIYAFMISYQFNGSRTGSTRVICFSKKGKKLWEKLFAEYTLELNPHCSYIRLIDNGQIYLRGHITKKVINEFGDGKSSYWEGWLDKKGNLTDKIGEYIDWEDEEKWREFFHDPKD